MKNIAEKNRILTDASKESVTSDVIINLTSSKEYTNYIKDGLERPKLE